MNKITTEIMEHLLKSSDYWDKKTCRIKQEKLIHDMTLCREALWLDRIYFPIASKLGRVYKNNNIPARYWDEGTEIVVPIEEWYEETVLCNGEELVMWRPADEILRDWLDNRFQLLFECIWYNHPDWLYEEPTEEELLAMDIQPGNIAAQAVLITGTEVPKRSGWKGPKAPRPPRKPKVEGDQPTQTSFF